MVTSICASDAVSLTLIHVASYLNSFEVFASLHNLRASIAAIMSGGRPSDGEPEELVVEVAQFAWMEVCICPPPKPRLLGVIAGENRPRCFECGKPRMPGSYTSSCVLVPMPSLIEQPPPGAATAQLGAAHDDHGMVVMDRKTAQNGVYDHVFQSVAPFDFRALNKEDVQQIWAELISSLQVKMIQI